MKRDTRLSGVLHLLLHMAHAPSPTTSEAMAKSLSSHPVVARRLMAGLREAGIVKSSKGHGGGWQLAATPEAITLQMVYEALGKPDIFAFTDHSPAATCLVAKAVNAALEEARSAAAALLMQRMEAVTLADIDRDFADRLAAIGMRREDIPRA
jgi:Rrf2 family protein